MMKLTILMPVYNEAGHIGKILPIIFEAVLPAGVEREVIVVDDGSTDGTAEVVEGLQRSYPLRLLRHARNLGKGAALRTGLKACSGDVVLFQDGDLEYSPHDYASLLAPLLAQSADVVYGSRFLGSARPKMDFLFYVANRFLTTFSNSMTRVTITDMETCYKLVPKTWLDAFALEENGFGVEAEITAKIAKRVRSGEIRIVEVPVSYSARTRRQGKKIGFTDGLQTLYCITKYNVR